MLVFKLGLCTSFPFPHFRSLSLSPVTQDLFGKSTSQEISFANRNTLLSEQGICSDDVEEEVWNGEIGHVFRASEGLGASPSRQYHFSVILAFKRLLRYLLQESDGLCDALLELRESSLVVFPGDVLNSSNANS